MTQPIKWHGGKHYLAKRIIELMPPHVHYVEAFFGGGSVLLQKPCFGVSEVVNDIHKDLTTFWKVLQEPARFEIFKRLVEATPFSSYEFMYSEHRQKQDFFGQPTVVSTEQYVRRAVDFFVCARQSRQGLMKDFATLSRNRTRRDMNEQASSWLTAIEGLPEVHARLKRVVILNDDAVKVIKQQDGPHTLFYLDPPYLHETRESTDAYAHEMTEKQHAELLLALDGIEGKFILSGYPSKLYDIHATTRGWHCERVEIDNKASSKDVKEKKTECLWMNYRPHVLAKSA